MTPTQIDELRAAFGQMLTYRPRLARMHMQSLGRDVASMCEARGHKWRGDMTFEVRPIDGGMSVRQAGKSTAFGACMARLYQETLEGVTLDGDAFVVEVDRKLVTAGCQVPRGRGVFNGLPNCPG